MKVFKKVIALCMFVMLCASLSITSLAALESYEVVKSTDPVVLDYFTVSNSTEKIQWNAQNDVLLSTSFKVEFTKMDPGNRIHYDKSIVSVKGYMDHLDAGESAPERTIFDFKDKIVTLTTPGLYCIESETQTDFQYISVIVTGPKDTTPTTPTNIEIKEAVKSSANVVVDGKSVSFDSFNIEDNNYFKLRDIATVLTNSEKKFEVTWDNENKAINLISGTSYTTVGGEMAINPLSSTKAQLNHSTIYKDSVETQMTAYTIEGNNYFKLRDIGTAFNFSVEWDGSTRTISIDTKS